MNRKNFLKTACGGLAGLFLLGATGVPYGQSNGTPSDKPKNKYTQHSSQNPAAVVDGFVHPTLASKSTEKVGLRLVLVLDISASINAAEYELQRQTVAAAVESDDFHNAIFYEHGPQSIAIAVQDFSTHSTLPIGWIDIRKGEDHKFDLLADEIRNLERREKGNTYHVTSLRFAETVLKNCPWESDRTVIDVMTDGRDNSPSFDNGLGKYIGSQKERLEEIRQRLARHEGATINALLTLDPAQPRLEEWAKNNLITQFKDAQLSRSPMDVGRMYVVATQATDDRAVQSYRDELKLAFRQKIVREVGNIDLQDLRDIMSSKEQEKSTIQQRIPSPG